jgi:hypothetical protein
MLNHDYFQFLAALHNRPANYSWWPGTVTEGDNAPDYIVSFKGFRNIHPGAHFIDFYPEIESDVASRRVPYKLLSTVNGPGKTQILVFRNVRLDSERPRG